MQIPRAISQASHQTLSTWKARFTPATIACPFLPIICLYAPNSATQARSQHSCNRLLADMSVLPSSWSNSAPTERILMKFHISLLFKNLYGKFKFH